MTPWSTSWWPATASRVSAAASRGSAQAGRPLPPRGGSGGSAHRQAAHTLLAPAPAAPPSPAVDGSAGLALKLSALKRHNAKLVVLPNTESVAPGAGAAAVAKGQRGSELGLRLTAGLVAAMSNGKDSDLLQLEEEFHLPNGVPKNEALHRLVETLTDFGVSSQE